MTNPTALRLISLTAALLLLAPAEVLAQESGAVPTQLWVTGDDGLTQRFTGAVRTALEESSLFSTSSVVNEKGLVLRIPTHVYSTKVEKRLNFQYVVILTDTDSRYLGVSIGPCWEENIVECADTVIRDAETAWLQRDQIGN